MSGEGKWREFFSVTKKMLKLRRGEAIFSDLEWCSWTMHVDSITQQVAREAMRVVFFCTYKRYLYAQN